MSMTTVAQPTSHAEWQYRLAMAFSHPSRHGALAGRNLLFTRKVLPIRAMQRRTQKAQFSGFRLFQLIPG